MMETAEGTQPVEVRGEFTVSQPPGIPEGSPIDVALAVNLGPHPAGPGTRFAWRLTIDGESLPGASLGFTTRPRARADAASDRLRPALRPLPRGLRPRRRLPALAGQDHHRVRRPPLLHDHHEPPPAAHQRLVRRARDGAGQERGGGQPRLLPRARHERARRERLVHRQPRGRVAAAPLARPSTATPSTPRPGCSTATPSKSKDDRGIVTVETKAFNQRGEEVCYFRRKLMVWKTRGRPGAAASLRRRRLGLSSGRSRPTGSGASGAAVLEWGDEHRRDLPWRRTRDPWPILVSEVMLQQTQVDRVVPHYERFLGRLPHAGGLRRRRPGGGGPACGRGSATTAGP